jgi:predicted O-methyltransferase YrrM
MTMFAAIPAVILRRMRELEARDERDRQDGTAQPERLRQIPPETGRFLAIVAAGAPPGRWIEIGTSGGYSGLWLALAARERSTHLTTFELLPAKARLARETFDSTGVSDVVEVREGDGLAGLAGVEGVSFCFLDAEKTLYLTCYQALVPKLVTGGLLLVDNVISHRDEIGEFLDAATNDARVDAVVVPIGKGVLLARRAGSDTLRHPALSGA